MKHIPLPAGPFKSWPFFQPDEIEQTATDDLRTHGLLPTQPAPVNIDKLVRSLFGFDPIYEDTGEGVLGFIRFGLTRPEKIILHVSLGSLDSETTEHRRRSTLAHECGHGRLHVAQFTELMQAKHSGRASKVVWKKMHKEHRNNQRAIHASSSDPCKNDQARDSKSSAHPSQQRSPSFSGECRSCLGRMSCSSTIRMPAGG